MLIAFWVIKMKVGMCQFHFRCTKLDWNENQRGTDFTSILYRSGASKVSGVLISLLVTMWLNMKYSEVLLSFQGVEIIKITSGTSPLFHLFIYICQSFEFVLLANFVLRLLGSKPLFHLKLIDSGREEIIKVTSDMKPLFRLFNLHSSIGKVCIVSKLCSGEVTS